MLSIRLSGGFLKRPVVLALSLRPFLAPVDIGVFRELIAWIHG